MKHKYSFDAEVLFAPFLDPTATVPFTRKPFYNKLYEEIWAVGEDCLLCIDREHVQYVKGNYNINIMHMPTVQYKSSKWSVSIKNMLEAISVCSNRESVVKVGEAFFYAEQIRILINTMRQLGEDTALLLGNNKYLLNEFITTPARIGLHPISFDEAKEKASGEVMLEKLNI